VPAPAQAPPSRPAVNPQTAAQRQSAGAGWAGTPLIQTLTTGTAFIAGATAPPGSITGFGTAATGGTIHVLTVPSEPAPQGTARWTPQQLYGFSDYPLFWVGPTFGSYNLQAVDRVRYVPPPGVPARYFDDAVVFTYGLCTPPPGSSRCFAPASVQVQPICIGRPETISDAVKAGPLTNVRGPALMQRFVDGHVVIWTGRARVRIASLTDPNLVEAGINQLSGVGTTQIASGQALPPPDFTGC
jgi:hypothetical protein